MNKNSFLNGKWLAKNKPDWLIGGFQLNVIWNLFYAFYNGWLALVYHSYWFFTMFVYYAVLGVMRASLIKAGNKRRVIRACGAGITLLSIVIAGVITLSIVEKRNVQYSIAVMLIIALFTFCLIINSIIGVIRAHRSHSPKRIVLRNISLVSAIGALLSMERAMLGTFGDPNNRFTFLMEAVSGFFAFCTIAGIGLWTIRFSKRKGIR